MRKMTEYELENIEESADHLGFDRVSEAFSVIAREFGKVFREVFKATRTIVSLALAAFEEQEEKKSLSQVFPKVDWDTRKRSQVACNKPRFVVRKII